MNIGLEHSASRYWINCIKKYWTESDTSQSVDNKENSNTASWKISNYNTYPRMLLFVINLQLRHEHEHNLYDYNIEVI